MEENKNLEMESIQENEEKSSFDFATIYTVLILNWKWFVLSLIICMGAAHIYLRYATPSRMTKAQEAAEVVILSRVPQTWVSYQTPMVLITRWKF